MTIKNTRLDLRTSQVTKTLLEQVAHSLGMSLSGFLIESAMIRAREIMAQTHVINLNLEEAAKFAQALENPPKPTLKLKALFDKHQEK